MKTTKSVIVSLLALAVSFSSAKAIVQSDIFLFNSGVSSTNGIQVDASTAANGFMVLNGKRNQSANSTFGGGVMLVDQTAATSKRRSLINNGGTLFQMDNNGVLLKVLLSTDLDSYSPNILGQQLDGFTTSPVTYENINNFTNILEAFQILASNQILFKNGGVALTSARITGGTAANDVILKTDNNKNLQVQLGVPGTTYNVLTTANLAPTANKLLEVNGESLTATSTTASFKVASATGTAYFAKIANFSPDLIVKFQTGTANQIQIVNGANVVTVNSGNTNVVIPGTNLQVDSFDGTNIVFEKSNSTGVNAKKADLVMHYFGQ